MFTIMHTFQVHIGRKISIDVDKYSRIMAITKSPGLTAGYIIIAAFGEETLMKSTLTGRQSNKSGKGKEKVDQLNPTVLLAYKGTSCLKLLFILMILYVFFA